MKVLRTLMVPLIIAVIVLAPMFLFKVEQTEYALKLRLGKVVSADYEPGLHLKWPWPWENIRYFDRRILTLDADAEHFLTSEKKNLIVDSFYLGGCLCPLADRRSCQVLYQHERR